MWFLLLGFGFCHFAMEILGIVWAASILTPSSILASSSEIAGRRSQQQFIPIEETAPWLSSLTDAYGWAFSMLEVETAYSSYAQSTNWLVPDFSRMEQPEGGIDTAKAPFTAIAPMIGPSVSSLAAPLIATTSPSHADGPEGLAANRLEVAESESLESTTEGTLVANKWGNWNAVASVQLNEADEQQPTPQEALLNFDSVCLRDTAAPYQESPIAMKSATKKQVWVHDHFIGDVASQVTGSKIAQKLRTLILESELEPSQLHPLIGRNFVGVGHRDDVLFIVDETMRSHPEVPATLVAVQWINNLRQAFDEKPLELADIQMAAEGLAETSDTLYGTASWYGPGFHGRKTANGEIFDENALTAAHKTLPFNTHLKITNRMNGKSVVVRINDRGPYIGKRSIDLSRAAAHCLGSTNRGVIPYEAVILKPIEKPDLDELTTAQLLD